MSDKDLFEAVATSIRNDHPSFRIRYKSESRFMALLGLLVYPFNQRFMDRMTTTIGSIVYLPALHTVRDQYGTYARVLAHEGVHIFDKERDGFMFFLKYLSPQILFLLPLIAFGLLGGWLPVAALVGILALAYVSLWVTCKFVESKDIRLGVFYGFASLAVSAFIFESINQAGWLSLLAALSVLLLIPWPAKWRAEYEYRGYAMGIAISVWKYGSYPEKNIARRAKTFTGFAYYVMCWGEVLVLERLFKIRQRVMDGSILKGPDAQPYRRTYEVYRKMGLVMSGVSNA